MLDLSEENISPFKSYFRPKTRGELMDALRNSKSCEVVASNEEITSLLLKGWAKDIKFKTRPSTNAGWVIYECID
jgi:hypothetical protein